MNRLSSIRTKLLLSFFIFILLFNGIVIVVYASSNKLSTEYHESFERFLLYNQLSQSASDLYEHTRAYLNERSDEQLQAYFNNRMDMITMLNQLKAEQGGEAFQLDSYIQLINTHIQNSEIAVGFVLRDNVEGYTSFLQNLQNTANFIQADTLNLIDIRLTDYQTLYQEMEDRNKTYVNFTVSLIATTVSLGALIALWVAEGINKPLKRLSIVAKEVSKGNFSGPPVDIKTNDELKLLGDSFNLMRNDLTIYIEELKEKAEMERLLSELEFRHLQNQMNPHFLFNTLNTVSKMAYLENADTTSGLIDSVSALLRYNLSHSKTDRAVALSEEVAVVESYFHIQQTRFQDRISFRLVQDEQQLDVLVPRLILQPLVENACIHGVEFLEEGGEIELRIYREQDQIICDVLDNGVGMTKEKIRQVMDQLVTDKVADGHSTQIGIANVRKRLSLFFQEDHLLSIHSDEGEGTLVRVRLPLTNKR
ncbi:sensor histidine kinase YesM [Alkalihalobacillus xiaoxiensis]|uniref:histidine kinase n=1 Tax=Shouchella xiaoxiensis TaxID=766895 RepID=A0ABS2SWT5_9BACI|nr:histidine kinase [Shouchella xiaoxiensis]MBM7839993.1 sensor histidine kinase YesM [Shouchella xiaoxiensis]